MKNRFCLTLLFLLLFAQSSLSQVAPSPDVRWSSPDQNAVSISSTGPSLDSLNRCLKEGFMMENRFEIQVCKKKRYWLDDCSDTVAYIRSLSEDPVTGRLLLRLDTLGDGEDPEERLVDKKEQGMLKLRELAPVTLESLKVDESDRKPQRLSIRVIEGCRGSYSSALRKISKVLTLGVVDIRGVDSGWIDFPLMKNSEQDQ